VKFIKRNNIAPRLAARKRPRRDEGDGGQCGPQRPGRSPPFCNHRCVAPPAGLIFCMEPQTYPLAADPVTEVTCGSLRRKVTLWVSGRPDRIICIASHIDGQPVLANIYCWNVPQKSQASRLSVVQPTSYRRLDLISPLQTTKGGKVLEW
jgi:hypothetical protein